MAGISQVKLNGIALDIDPVNYVMLGGRRRGSVHRLIDGTTVYQDRGFSASDISIQISGVLTDVTTLRALCSLYAKISTTFTFEDFKDNKFTVIFTPGVEAFNPQPIYGSNRAFTYTMLLSVVSVENFLSTSLGFPSNT